jgi:predicted nucleotidyltransferase
MFTRSGLVHEWDLLTLPGGEILSAVGTFAGDLVRARLAYVPDHTGPTIINTRRYRKITYEVWPHLLYARRQVMALPGENHYLIHTAQVRHWYPGINPADHDLPPAAAALVQALADIGATVRLGGSRAIGCHTDTADFDWVVHADPGQVTSVAAAVRALPGIGVSVPGGMVRMRAKYAHFHALRDADLRTLIADRWRHMTVDGVQMSVDFADPDHLADAWLRPLVYRDRGSVTGVITDTTPCYRTPKILYVDAPEPVQVITWLNLYTGALCDGDLVEATGTWIEHNDRRYLLVDDSGDAIRVLARTTSPAHVR